MKIIPYITNEEIEECRKLLHEDYQDCKVRIYHNRIKFLIDYIIKIAFEPSELMNYFKCASTGFYHPSLNEVWIPIFSYRNKNPRYVKLEVILTLYHELRHHYQWNKKPKLAQKRGVLNVKDKGYSADPTERDANRFASRMINKYKDEISNILNVYPEWYVDL